MDMHELMGFPSRMDPVDQLFKDPLFFIPERLQIAWGKRESLDIEKDVGQIWASFVSQT
jgi:hypothetical protein